MSGAYCLKNREADLREQAALRAQERSAWAARWPEHCPTCEGAGAFIVCSYDETDGEPCDECQGRSCRCPRCAEPGVSIFQQAGCRSCGWEYGGEDAVMPSNEPLWRLESELAWAAGDFTDPFAEVAL